MLKYQAPWLNAEILRAKQDKKKKERLWHIFRTDKARRVYRKAKNIENWLVTKGKSDYYRSKVEEAGSSMNKLYKALGSLTGHKKYNKLHDGLPNAALASMFLYYFDKKVEILIKNLRPDSFQRPAPDMPVAVAKYIEFSTYWRRTRGEIYHT